MSKKLIKISIIVVALILVFILGVYSYNSFFYKPSKIVESVNENVTLLNNNVTQTQQLIDNINLKYNDIASINISDLNRVIDSNNSLKDEVNSIDVLIQNNIADKDKLNEGVDDQSEDFNLLAQESIDQRNSILETLKNVIIFDTCLNEHYFSLLNYNNQANLSISKLNELTLNTENIDEIININNESIQSLESSITSFKSIGVCLDESQKDLVSSVNSVLVLQDAKSYGNFINSLRQFNAGLSENNIELINESQKKLDNNSLVSVFLKDNVYQKNIQDTNQILIEEYDELKSIEARIDKAIDDIK